MPLTARRCGSRKQGGLPILRGGAPHASSRRPRRAKVMRGRLVIGSIDDFGMGKNRPGGTYTPRYAPAERVTSTMQADRLR
jgi:hypothetical protein